MFALLRRQEIHLSPTRGQRARIFASNAEKHQFGNIAEIETDTASVRAAGGLK